jgi:hypothetical protein
LLATGFLAALVAACAKPPTSVPPAAPTFEHFEAQPAAVSAGYCAWYGDTDGEVLYFGESAFWAAMRRAKGDPTGDLDVEGPKRIGRFDLGQGQMEAPITVDVLVGSGVWDVLASKGRVYFTTFFGSAGFIDTSSGALSVLDDLGPGLNELAPGPGDSLVASRYGAAGGGPGSLVVFSRDGALRAEHVLSAPAGYLAAPKTVAWDPRRGEFWVTVDLVAQDGTPPRQDARRLSAEGRELARIDDPEIQFVAFASDGTGYLAARSGRTLSLLVLDAGSKGDPMAEARRMVLDQAFDGDLDFVQDIHPTPDGRVVLTRWSGRVHVVEPAAERFTTVDFPREGGEGIYYSAVLAEGRLCATYCAGVQVICTKAP